MNDDCATPHNFHVSGPGGFDAKTAIFTEADGGSRKLTFTLDQPSDYTFVCDVHPSQMKGEDRGAIEGGGRRDGKGSSRDGPFARPLALVTARVRRWLRGQVRDSSP